MFLWMVRTVVIAGSSGLVIAFYLRPLYTLDPQAHADGRRWAAILTLLA